MLLFRLSNASQEHNQIDSDVDSKSSSFHLLLQTTLEELSWYFNVPICTKRNWDTVFSVYSGLGISQMVRSKKVLKATFIELLQKSLC